ncbi:NRDE family protein [Aequorivita sp. F47161]|uniref:NRDE family protein n=1 Tax=Aequorivita vitellina TaxID=2874475 RepID=A0A9X1U969_9FLAO|nr:NRDE family protein [Aequorivita vitellina]MCG2418191.1 NRDE family protein [Aequorivita vitellina]MCZ4318076.1 NRDE family protein [Aequorivita viscosa]
MCTVTFIPKPNKGFILTSNRDEAPGRETFPPEIYKEEGVKLLYPKDAVAGGTWIGISEKKRVVTLMNGGFVAHKRKPFYRKSRGLVVKDLLKCENLIAEIENYDFNEIEPFTAIIVEWKTNVQLFQLVWDGKDYHFSEKPLSPHIWSSSPLYPENLKNKREQWFSAFLMNALKPSEAEILQFHKTGGEGDFNSNLIMDRGFIKTKSITQIVQNKDSAIMRYEDLQTKKISTTQFIFP